MKTRLLAALALALPAAAWASPCFHMGSPVVCPINPNTGLPLPDGSFTVLVSAPQTQWRIFGTTINVFIIGVPPFTPFVATPPPPPVVGPILPNQARDVLALTRASGPASDVTPGGDLVKNIIAAIDHNPVVWRTGNQKAYVEYLSMFGSVAPWMSEEREASQMVARTFDPKRQHYDLDDAGRARLEKYAREVREATEPQGNSAAETRDFLMQDGHAFVFSDQAATAVARDDSAVIGEPRFRVPLPSQTGVDLPSADVKVTLIVFATDAEGNVLSDIVTLVIDSPSLEADPATGSATAEYSSSTAVQVTAPAEIVGSFTKPSAKPMSAKPQAELEAKLQQDAAARIVQDLKSPDPAKRERGKKAFEFASPEVRNLVSTNVQNEYLSAAQVAGDALQGPLTFVFDRPVSIHESSSFEPGFLILEPSR